MNFKIITDSCCDLGKTRLKELGVAMAPLGVDFGDRFELDGELDLKDFYEGMRAGVASTTSAVNPDGWAEKMEPILRGGEDVLVLAFSSGLSATYQSAVIAAEELAEKYPRQRIRVIDTLSASVGQGLLVWNAVRMSQAGKSMDEVADWVLKYRDHVAHWVTVEDLKYLKRGGRISATTAVVGTMLSIKPIIHVDTEGKLTSVDKCRGRKASMAYLVEKLGATILPEGLETVFLSHADCPEDAAHIAQQVQSCFGVKEVIISDIGPVIGSHTGPGCLALCFLAREK